MSEAMRSRERVLAAYTCQEPDRVPIVFRSIGPMAHRWRDQVNRAEVLLGLGADDVLAIAPPDVPAPGVTSRVWCEPGTPYDVLHKEWHTPVGTLHASVQRTPD